VENIGLIDSPKLKAAIDKYSPFIREVRRRLIITLSIFAVSTLIGFIFYEQIIKFLVGALSLKGINIVFTSPFQFINLAIACGAAVGLIFVFPLIIYQLLSFLRPALKKRIQNDSWPIPFSIILFLMGFTFEL
jgi:sec-independent protein translocase protein TatC